MENSRPNRDRMPELTLHWGNAQPAVAAFVRSIVHNHHDAEDVIQATVTHIVDHYDEYDPARPFVAWAIGIARIRILHHRDQNKRRPLMLGDRAIDALGSAIAHEAEQMDDRLEALEHCLGRLSPRHQRVLALRYQEKVSRPAIAEALGIRENSVSVLLRRVRLILENCVTQRIGGLSK